MNKQQLLKHLQNEVYCRIGVSKIHGVGVFAIRDIPKNTNPFKHSFNGEGIVFSTNELEKLPKEVQKIIDDFLVHEKDGVLIPVNGLNQLDISFYLNHSENPNVKTGDNGETFITMRDIKKDEELTYIYTPIDQEILQKQKS